MAETRIKELRESLGLNQLQMAKELGMQAQTIHRYEEGDVEPTLKKYSSHCRDFQCQSCLVDRVVG